MSKWFICLFLLLTLSCSNKNEVYFQKMGEEVKAELFQELSSVENFQDLLIKQDRLISIFQELATIQIELNEYQSKNQKVWVCNENSLLTSDGLEEQFRRIITIPGAYAFIEKCQAGSLAKLMSYEKSKKSNI